MEPVSLITAALVAGAAKTAGEAVQDAYKGLKELIKRKYEEKGKSDFVSTLDKYEQKPEKTKGLLEDELTEAEIDQDKEIMKKVNELQELLKATKSADSTSQKVFNSTFTAEKQAIQQGDGGNQTVNM
ncbi:hypothetical protein [Nostoc sp. TCL26-01]|uniref:hypothetical protein n=1 Tax=Nostoc sp. TCL26-01 TaxID=2576904 RepID=UPI0015B901CC|nr:hypothetical protein [Nostoc sp. TCL26-01]QLE57849.1 hypothetical protein FD725_21410 [Nostoc sp. TCL26-01]